MTKKLLVYTSKLHRGGAEKHLVRLCNALQKRGWSITIVVTQSKGGYETMLNNGIRIVALKHHFKSYTLSLLMSIRKLNDEVKSVMPDLIFSLQDGPNVALLALDIIKRNNIPIVIGVQNNPYYLPSLVKWLVKLTYKYATKCISLSKGVAQAYEKLVPSTSGKIVVIPNIGIEMDPVGIKVNNRKLVEPIKLLAVGRIVEQKDYPTMLRAVKVVERNDIDFKLKILGNGELEGNIKELVKSMELENSVRFEGFVNHPDVYYETSDILLLSSKWEGFGNVIVEAMSFGVPVIATKCPFGPSEIIEDGENGFLVDVGDHKAMANRINYLVNNSNKYTEMSKAARIRSRIYSSGIIAEEYEKVFLNVL